MLNLSPLFLILSLTLLTACGGSSEQSQNNIQTGSATYKVIFQSDWSAVTHPDNFPSNPHFSGLIGATHNINTVYWKEASLASAGIESMAENGGKITLSNEINTNINLGDSDQILSGGGISSSPGNVELVFTISPHYSFVTLVSMLAPSPDWFIGVSGLNLMENGVWLESKTIELYVYDAGTDDGLNYTSADANSNPKQFISKIATSPFLVNSQIKPIGTFFFQKQ